MQDILSLLALYGSWLVFLNVLAEQSGLPIPAYPLLVAAGAMAAGPGAWTLSLLAAVAACLLADSGWYLAGRRYGGRLLGLICKLSLSQDSCIRQTQSLYLRIGPRSLLVSKFLPGAGALATVMAGLTGTPYRRFFGFEFAGSVLWAASGLLLGALFRGFVTDVLDALDRYGAMSLAVVLGVLVAYVALRALRRFILIRSLRVVPRLSIDELLRWQTDGQPTVMIDVRPEGQRESQRIPGAISVDVRTPLEELVMQLPHAHIVVYCGCPHEISAAKLAARLRAAGYSNTWALAGGYEAWQQHAHAV